LESPGASTTPARQKLVKGRVRVLAAAMKFAAGLVAGALCALALLLIVRWPRYQLLNAAYSTTVLRRDAVTDPESKSTGLFKMDRATGRVWEWHRTILEKTNEIFSSSGWAELTNGDATVPWRH
jgi:hypothetical protein